MASKSELYSEKVIFSALFRLHFRHCFRKIIQSEY